MALDPRPPQTRPPQKSVFGSSMGEAAPYLGLGLQITISMVFFVLLGYFADDWLGTSPWLLFVGVVLSAVATAATIYRTVREMDDASRRKRALEGGSEDERR